MEVCCRGGVVEMQGASGLDQRPSSPVDTGHRQHAVIGSGVCRRGGGPVIADRRDHDHAPPPCRCHRAFEHGIARTDQADGDDARAILGQPAEAAGDRQRSTAGRVRAVDIGNADIGNAIGAEEVRERAGMVAWLACALGKSAKAAVRGVGAGSTVDDPDRRCDPRLRRAGGTGLGDG